MLPIFPLSMKMSINHTTRCCVESLFSIDLLSLPNRCGSDLKLSSRKYSRSGIKINCFLFCVPLAYSYFCRCKTDKRNCYMTNGAAMQGVYVNVPTMDWSLFRELVRKFGWQVETREQLLDRFVNSRPATPVISEEEIMDEVKAVRYAK